MCRYFCSPAKRSASREIYGCAVISVALLSVARAGKIPDGGAWRLIRATKASKPRLNPRRHGPLTPARG
ncbi:hypothetical protein DMQ72_17580 [Klebsiella quasipneumoniae]|uniref:Uncharacterized protein n=1 Tax=Klebsiella quasipneumoniae TaxID=1463165 RepID=A0AAI8NLX6_9ENTR|nr:hypothetical protein DKC11_14000 [Klebsiella quasipneumoniae]AWX85187.1 hypothetical protein DP204_00530 [Klebsiella quasipneumoniae subsp. quasipneumoniae]AWL63744.1 hypothetical protein DKC00_19175 [Klebsiella quasipneumoniae]AWL74808.1 hypothetical protein DKC09_17675 [Klebsiella quasipneumoniae]PLM24825.1 hypothetical protein CWN58_24955 [Klebsiella quasipneumoniae]